MATLTTMTTTVPTIPAIKRETATIKPEHEDSNANENDERQATSAAMTATTTTTTSTQSVNFDKDVVFEREGNKGLHSSSPPKLLHRESFSSPDLVGMAATLDPVPESLPSHPQPTKPSAVLSFRDALISKMNQGTIQDDNDSNSADVATTITRTRKRIKPRIVVTAPPVGVRRCAKSTGDLPSLAAAVLNDNGGIVSMGGATTSTVGTSSGYMDNDDDDDILGYSDANEYYERKRQGHQSRRNGLKVRPDEAKRRLMSMHKKDLQRRRQATRGK